MNASEDDSWITSLVYFSLTFPPFECYILSTKWNPMPFVFHDLPLKSCSVKLWNFLAKSTTEEFSLCILVWTFSNWTFWMLLIRSPWDVTVTLSPLTQLHSPDTCRFRPSLIFSRLSEKESKRPHTPSSLESLRSRPSLARRHSPISVTWLLLIIWISLPRVPNRTLESSICSVSSFCKLFTL